VTTRELPRTEFWRLADADELWKLWQVLPEATRVFVVEDDGQIVGRWSLVPVWHAEGIWIHPAYRRRGGAALRLWRAVRSAAKRLGVRAVYTAAQDSVVAGLIQRRNGHLLPGQHFTLPIGE
jgi:GNAT superfamily N-acetyltransferase